MQKVNMDHWTPFLPPMLMAKHPDQRVMWSRRVYIVILGNSKVTETSVALSCNPQGRRGFCRTSHAVSGEKKNSTDTNIVCLERLSHLIFLCFISKWGLMNCISCEMTALSPERIWSGLFCLSHLSSPVKVELGGGWFMSARTCSAFIR